LDAQYPCETTKKGDVLLCNNWRGISLLSVLGNSEMPFKLVFYLVTRSPLLGKCRPILVWCFYFKVWFLYFYQFYPQKLTSVPSRSCLLKDMIVMEA
jgi:hypothetical protein